MSSLEQPKIKPIPITIALMIGAFIGLLSETALNMAFTEIMSDFGIQTHAVQWLTTGYLLVLGILVPISALLLQWFSTRQLFSASLLFSILGTLVAAIAPNFAVLMIARVIQAIGTGLLLPLMTTVILVIFPAHKRGTIMGTMGLVITFAPAVGPTLSGLVVDKLSWHWIFWICLPLLLFTFLFGLKFMQNVSTITKPKIDILSVVLSTIGFGGIVYGFSNAGEGAGSWGDPLVIIPLLLGIIGLTLFTIRQLRMEQPMLNLRVFKFRMFTFGVLIVFICMMLILSASILLPLYLKGGLMLAAFSAGLMLLPGGIINGLMSPITGRLFDKFGPRGLVMPGFIITTVFTYLFSNVTTETTTIAVIVMHTCLFIGVAMIMMPAQTNGLNQLPKEHYPDGAAVMNTLQQIAGAIGTAIAISIMSAGQTKYMTSNAGEMTDPIFMSKALAAGVQNAFMFAFIASMIGLIISLFVRRVKV
ncbi:DHA2 family efflux MFS transporter permease subunit [Paenibacillus sp. Marseille-Q4541]|uniref:DHA2 family efflux MFS transporter permease subunit n=1 Tax=Paenibacillus sp. Marseille-Q4541 TaxID=2831522 RepID=UPI001BA740D5|nr:DHA2 family efflux MFS transporter permease subunit [Paenibacillus sp. Marseille-Q4541]